MKPTAILSALIMAASFGGLQAQSPQLPLNADSLPATAAPQTPPPASAPTPPANPGANLPPPPRPPHPDSREANQDHPRDDRGPRPPKDDRNDRDIQARDEHRGGQDARPHRDEPSQDARPRRDEPSQDARPRRDERRDDDRPMRPERRTERRSHLYFDDRRDDRQPAPSREDRRPEFGEQRGFQERPRFEDGPRSPRRFRGFERGGYGEGQPPMDRPESRHQDERGQASRPDYRDEHARPETAPRPPMGGPGQSHEGGNPPPRGNDAGPRPVPPLFGALDSNHDGILSQQEIADAANALSALDRNRDGQITIEEVRPMPPHDGSRGGAFQGPRGPGPREEGPRNGSGPEGHRAPLPY